MVALGGTYEADAGNLAGDFTPVPPGDYKVIVVESEMKPTKSGTGNYLQLELEIIEGEHTGRKVIERLNIDNPNTQAVDIAQRSLNSICVAVGKMSITDSNELHSIPMIAVIKVDAAKPYMKDGVQQDGLPGNSIRTYKPIGAAASTFAASTPSPAASNVNSSPPWKRAS